MIELAGAVLAASFIGSPHCAGMCGGFVAFVAGQERRRLLPQAAYHLGRLASYATLGAFAGLIGQGANRAGLAIGWTRGAAILAGALMVLWGAAGLAAALRLRGPSLGVAPWLHRLVPGALRLAAPWPPALRALVMGLVTTLLPCGFLWAFVATASGAGHPLGGMLVMAAFWLGTVPVLAGLGLAARRLLGPLERRLPVLTASLLLVLGLLTMAGKIVPAITHPEAPGSCCSSHERH